jgi:LPS O-antigen subunit length determinant protein (WzzB/FepE family)
MVDLNKQEVKIIFKFVNKFLKQFESSPLEEEFWNKTYNINELKMIRNKLKLVLEDA